MPRAYKRANGTGGVTKLSGRRRNPYYARVTVGWDDDGKQRYANLGCYKTRAEALSALEDYLKNPSPSTNINPTLAELYDITLGTQRIKALHPNTQSRMNTAFNRLKRYHDVSYKKLPVAEIQSLISTYPYSGQISLVNLFHHLNIQATLLDLHVRDYGTLLKAEQYKKQNVRSYFTEKEINKIWKNKDDYYCKLLLVYLYTGLRLKELLDLPVNNIDWKEWTIRGGEKTEAGRNRIIPIHTRIRPIMCSLFSDGHKANVLDGRASDTVAIYLRKEIKELGFKHVIHETRHTFRSRLDNADVKPVIINLLMGHKSGSVGEDVYTHKTLAQLREAIERLR